VEYRTHISNKGWLHWVSDGEESGEIGQRIEAIEIRVKERIVRREWPSRIWQDLISNDPARVQATLGKMGSERKSEYIVRLLSIISDSQKNDLSTRIAAGNALGVLGDPRLQEMEMVVIPEGPFRIGSSKGKENEVYLDAFEIAKYPLTNVQYKAFLDATPKHPAPADWDDRMFPPLKANHPVVNISWHDAQAYAEWLNRQTGKHYRLPTEAEWKKAARGDRDAREYPWGDAFDSSKCNTRESGPAETTPVGIYPEGASPYGLMDMAGNVWEWTSTLYGSGETRRVVRGGSWGDSQGIARCSLRDWVLPDYRCDDLGVRFSRTS